MYYGERNVGLCPATKYPIPSHGCKQIWKDPTILDKAMSETTNQRYGCVASVFSCDDAYVILVSQLITHWWFSSKFLSKKQGGKLGAHVCCLNRHDGD